MTAPDPVRHASRWWLLRDVALVLGLFAVVGALCGVLWEVWWDPPSGVVLDHRWYADDQGLTRLFSGTGTYVVVGAAGGLVTGAVCAWLVDRVELLTLAAVTVGAVLAAWLMLKVGTSLAPPDPAALADTAADRTALPATLEVTGEGPLAAFPAGALLGVIGVFIGLTPAARRR